ncbi:hypothetical protein [Sporosalibacterium faouarense]|uniref:hypothetical protein n=1 Tax=Sporosalibacterium faouarense TaxID=516123 RepID=UPI00141C18B5|nr:hypothetical protein [Sporosalibacterium faouarense]MTI47076.1 hypothetical protein [Bacillota bacterium]
MKLKALGLAFLLSVSLLAGCSTDSTDNNNEGDQGADVVTTASLVNDADGFTEAISENGTWIIATLNDISIDEEIVVAGEFHNKGDASQDVYRKLAPYTQDDEHNIIDRFTITVPRVTIQSPNTRLQGGTIKGDVYVAADGFNLSGGATIDGNLYFANEEYKASSEIPEDCTVTGEVEVKEMTDAVAAASLDITDGEVFKKSVGKDGKWIIATVQDITIEDEVVVEGEFHNKGDASQDVYRKLAPYTQDDEHNILDRFTITVPKMTIKSPNTRLQGGTVKGDVYVEANGFNLSGGATIDGNLYFANEEYKASSEIPEDCTVTGSVEVQ